MNNLSDFHFYDVCSLEICFCTAWDGMADRWITFPKKLVCELVTVKWVQTKKICSDFITKMTWILNFQNYPLPSHNSLRCLLCCRWMLSQSLCFCNMFEDAAMWHHVDILVVEVKQERGPQKLTGRRCWYLQWARLRGFFRTISIEIWGQSLRRKK
jgi:hypothetical protein